MTDTTLPFRLQQAQHWQNQLAERGIHFLAVRHHSPACAYATLQALQQLQPAHVLIEAPKSFNPLLSDLQHPDSQPPLAILCQTELSLPNLVPESGAETPQKYYRSAYFPFCDYSPEWVALRTAKQINAQVEFIDLAWSSQVAHEQQVSHTQSWQAQSLQQERYLAHSQYIQALASRLNCRNHDELWDHLFELKSKAELSHWQQFFAEVQLWCSMSRLDYEPSVLAAEASLIRERCMLQSILDCHTQAQGDICIITGGFHTLALIEELAGQLLQDSPKPLKKFKSADQEDQAWLIRYSFDRLDALNGYASGMPSPAFYQRCWQQLNTLSERSDAEQRQRLCIDVISDLSQQLRQQQVLDSSFITVKTASEQAVGLAALREHALISRYDLIDACQSSFVKGSLDDGQQAFQQTLMQLLSGAKLGQVVSSTQTPPLLAQVVELAKAHRFKLDDTISKRAKLDVLRNPKHRLRSRFLHLLSFLQVGFARHQTGPDFLTGGQLHLLFEEWEYAWTPQVEARLIELSAEAGDVQSLAIQQLLQLKQRFYEAGQGRSSHQAVQLLLRAAVMGLHQQIPALFAEVQQYLPNDPELSSVIQCGQKLLNLWTGKDFLGFRQQPELKALLQQVLPSALFLLEQHSTPAPEQQQAVLQQVLQLRELAQQIERILDCPQQLLSQLYQSLQRLDVAWQKIDLLAGGRDALAFLDGKYAEQDLQQSLLQRFGIGATPEHAVQYLSGILQAAPELLLHYRELGDLLNQLLTSWDEQTFIALLPDLRFAFTYLKPKETSHFAEHMAQLNQVSSLSLTVVSSEISQTEMLQGVQLNQQLVQLLQQQQLEMWFTQEEQA